MGNADRMPADSSKRALLGFKWKRVAAWSFLIYATISLVAFAFGLSMAAWHIYGATLEEAIETNRLVRMVVYWTTAALLYWRFAAPLHSSRLLHVLAVFALIELINAAVLLFAFGDPLADLLDPWATGRALLAAAIGWGLASVGSNNSFKPNPFHRFVQLCRRGGSIG